MIPQSKAFYTISTVWNRECKANPTSFKHLLNIYKHFNLIVISALFSLSAAPVGWQIQLHPSFETGGLIKMAHNCSGIGSLARSKLIRR